MRVRGLATIAVSIGLAALICFVGKLSLQTASVNPTASPVWPITGIALAALLLFAGALGDRFGRRRALLAGIAIFGLASLLSVFTDSAGTLIGWRVLAGVGAALIMPGTLSTITSVFPPEERAKAVGDGHLARRGLAAALNLELAFLQSTVGQHHSMRHADQLPVGEHRPRAFTAIVEHRVDTERFEFAPFKGNVAGQFQRVVRKLEFDVAEIALMTFLIAKAHGKPYRLLPFTVMARYQHPFLKFNPERTPGLKPGDLAGRRVGVRSYSVTTGAWIRHILAGEYGVDLAKIKWVTFEEAHVAEFVDPPNVERASAGKEIKAMLLAGELDAAILGDSAPDPRLQPLIADAEAAGRRWSATSRRWRRRRAPTRSPRAWRPRWRGFRPRWPSSGRSSTVWCATPRVDFPSRFFSGRVIAARAGRVLILCARCHLSQFFTVIGGCDA